MFSHILFETIQLLITIKTKKIYYLENENECHTLIWTL